MSIRYMTQSCLSIHSLKQNCQQDIACEVGIRKGYGYRYYGYIVKGSYRPHINGPGRPITLGKPFIYFIYLFITPQLITIEARKK